jgi:hypothetical protein
MEDKRQRTVQTGRSLHANALNPFQLDSDITLATRPSFTRHRHFVPSGPTPTVTSLLASELTVASTLTLLLVLPETALRQACWSDFGTLPTEPSLLPAA